MVDKNEQAFQRELAALRLAYGKGLTRQVREIADRVDSLLGSWRQETAQELREMVHKIAGSGGAYGLHRVSLEAKQMESHLDALLGTEPSAAALAELQRFFGRLEKAVQAETSTEGGADHQQDDVPDPEGTLDPDGPQKQGKLAEDGNVRGRAEEPELDAIQPPEETEDRDESLVVLVGREPESSETLASLLEASGYRLRHFRDALELQGVGEGPLPAAVLVDLETLPDPDSRSRVSGAAPPVAEEAPPQIVFSSRSGIEARLRAVRSGSVAYLTEPFDPELLVETLDRLTARTSAAPYRVLIVDDDPAASAQTSLYLRRRGMQVAEVADPLAVEGPLVELQPDLILMDLHMPGCSGMELAATLRQLDPNLRVPIVFLSAESDPDTQFGDMLRVGEDVLDKSMAPGHLVLAVANHARRSRLLSSMMSRDSLTGLYSHATLMERLDQEMGKARRLGHPLTFAMADLDGFKMVNDQHGHRAGDRVLRSFGRFLRRQLAGHDLAGRYGGDEFGIVLPGSSPEGARKILDQVRRRFSAIHHPTPKGGVRVTLSIGAADFPRHADLGSLTRAADQALYQAEDDGRNQVALVP